MYLLLSIHRNCFSEDIPLWQADWVEPVPSASKANVLATTLEGNWFQMLKNKAYEVLTVLLSKQFSLVTDIWLCVQFSLITGKSLSEALILGSLTHNMTKDCSFIYQFSTWKLQSQNQLCTQIVFCFDIQNNLCTYKTCSPHVLQK